MIIKSGIMSAKPLIGLTILVQYSSAILKILLIYKKIRKELVLPKLPFNYACKNAYFLGG